MDTLIPSTSLKTSAWRMTWILGKRALQRRTKREYSRKLGNKLCSYTKKMDYFYSVRKMKV